MQFRYLSVILQCNNSGNIVIHTAMRTLELHHSFHHHHNHHHHCHHYHQLEFVRINSSVNESFKIQICVPKR